MKPSSESVPVTRVELRRVPVAEYIQADELLRACPLLKTMTAEQGEALLTVSLVRRFARGAFVFREGEPASALYLVLRGEVRLCRGEGADSVDGALVRKGEVLGEAELVERTEQRRQSARAEEEADVAEVPFEKVMIAAQASEALVRHLRALHVERQAAQDEMANFLSRW